MSKDDIFDLKMPPPKREYQIIGWTEEYLKDKTLVGNEELKKVAEIFAHYLDIPKEDELIDAFMKTFIEKYGNKEKIR